MEEEEKKRNRYLLQSFLICSNNMQAVNQRKVDTFKWGTSEDPLIETEICPESLRMEKTQEAN